MHLHLGLSDTLESKKKMFVKTLWKKMLTLDYIFGETFESWHACVVTKMCSRCSFYASIGQVHQMRWLWFHVHSFQPSTYESVVHQTCTTRQIRCLRIKFLRAQIWKIPRLNFTGCVWVALDTAPDTGSIYRGCLRNCSSTTLTGRHRACYIAQG